MEVIRLNRRSFFQLLAVSAAASYAGPSSLLAMAGPGSSPAAAAAIPNNSYRFLPGERDALAATPKITAIEHGTVVSGAHRLHPNESVDGWRLLTATEINGVATAVLEKRVTYRGAIVYMTVDRGVIATIPTFIGDLSTITPRPVAAPAEKQLTRRSIAHPGPDVPGDYILSAAGDPSWNTVAALGPEYLGWTLVGNQISGPERSLFLAEDGTSRELNDRPPQAAWAPDELGPVLDPSDFFPTEAAELWQYQRGWSKRTLLGGYTPTANIGVWNPDTRCGYELAVILPETREATPVTRVLITVPEDQIKPGMHVLRDAKGRAFLEHYRNGDAAHFFSVLLGIWLEWHTLFESSMPVEIPDENLRDSARAGIMLSRCSYRGMRPTYQIGEGAYTMIPERSHALFPVAAYEFVWAQQLWGLSSDAGGYLQFYLDHYILPNGNFLYNTQDQVEAPLNVGLFLRNSARGFFYTRDLAAFQAGMPVLRRMLDYVVERYNYTREHFAQNDPHFGLIWGSPEADLGGTQNDFPASHPFYFQNAANVWRGVHDYAAAMALAANTVTPPDSKLAGEATRLATLADSMHADLDRSLRATLERREPAMKQAGISPFFPEDIKRDPHQLSSYETHRFMQDWFLADWTDPAIDRGHLRHRELAGLVRAGLTINGPGPRMSNFMEHGTLAARIRETDYRPFLLTLFGLVCYAADSGSRYSPEDALIPGGYAGEGNKYSFSAVVNSVLQPTLGLRWLLCYEESDQPLVHLQKAAPCEWFAPGERIHVGRCPTRFGEISWTTESYAHAWTVTLRVPAHFAADLLIHVHPVSRAPLTRTSLGSIEGSAVRLSARELTSGSDLSVEVATS